MKDSLWVAVGKVANFLEIKILAELSTFHSVVIFEHYSRLFGVLSALLSAKDLHE